MSSLPGRPHPTPRHFGIAPLTHLQLSPPEMVTTAADAGYDFVGLRLIPATAEEPQHDTRGTTPLVRETARRLHASGLYVADIEIFRLQPTTRIADFEPVLAAGALLGARHALAAPQDADAARLADRVAALAELAAAHGIGVDLEPTPWYEISTLAACAAVIAASGRNDVGLVVDPIHFDRAGETPAAIATLPAAYFRYAQLCDAPAARPTDRATLLHQARAERLMPGDGGLDLAGILRALPAGLPLSLEIPMRARAASETPLALARQMLDKARTLLADIDVA
jgi:sugar phosphate isomerase/epimerase